MEVNDSSFSELLEHDKDVLRTALEQIAEEYHSFLEGKESEYSIDCFPEFKEANVSWTDEDITRAIHSTVLLGKKDAIYLEISAYKQGPGGVKSSETELAVVNMQNMSPNLGFAYETVRQFTEEDMVYDQSL